MPERSRRFSAEIEFAEPGDTADPAWWFVFRGSELLIRVGEVGDSVLPRHVSLAEITLEPQRINYLGRLSGAPVYAAELADSTSPPDGLRFHSLRSLHGLVDDELFVVAGRAAQIVEWDRTHQFCGRCGSRTEYASGERAKRCTS